MEDTKLVEFAKGHANAFGVAITDENIQQFIKLTNELLKDKDFIPVSKVDFIWNSNTVNPQDILEIADLHKIWGQKLEEPLIVLKDVKIYQENIQLLKETTIKITLPNGISLIKFNSNEDEFNELYPTLSTGCTKIDVLGKCAANTWGGITSPQIKVEDWDIINKINYVF